MLKRNLLLLSLGLVCADASLSSQPFGDDNLGPKRFKGANFFANQPLEANEADIVVVEYSGDSKQSILYGRVVAEGAEFSKYRARVLHNAFVAVHPDKWIETWAPEANMERPPVGPARYRVSAIRAIKWTKVNKYYDELSLMAFPKELILAANPRAEQPEYDHYMEDCLKLHRDGLISRGALYFKNGENGKEQKILFSDFRDGTADLSKCEEWGNYQVYTLNEDRLRLVRGANRNKSVTFIGAFQKFRHLLPTDANGSVSDVVVIWRDGDNPLYDDKGKRLFDYLVIDPARLTDKNMFEHWIKASGRGGVDDSGGRRWCGGPAGGSVFHVRL